MDNEYEIDVEHHVNANLADCWTWEVDWADGNAAGTTYVDESTARICAQAVIDALSPEVSAPTLGARCLALGMSLSSRHIWATTGRGRLVRDGLECFSGTLADAHLFLDGWERDTPQPTTPTDAELGRTTQEQETRTEMTEMTKREAWLCAAAAKETEGPEFDRIAGLLRESFPDADNHAEQLTRADAAPVL